MNAAPGEPGHYPYQKPNGHGAAFVASAASLPTPPSPDALSALLAAFSENGWRVSLADDGDYARLGNGGSRRFGGDWTAEASGDGANVVARDPTPDGALRRALAMMRAATGREG